MKNDSTVHTVLGFKVWSYPAAPKPEWKPTPNSAGHISKEEWFGTWQDKMFAKHAHVQKLNKKGINTWEQQCQKRDIKK